MKRLLSLVLLVLCACVFFPLGCGGGASCSVHDDCESGELCIFSTGKCGASCDPKADACSGGSLCDACGTSSCPDCRDCSPVCVEPISGGGGW